jgi:hypothetical protein
MFKLDTSVFAICVHVPQSEKWTASWSRAPEQQELRSDIVNQCLGTFAGWTGGPVISTYAAAQSYLVMEGGLVTL